jgi:hypothetical protein
MSSKRESKKSEKDLSDLAKQSLRLGLKYLRSSKTIDTDNPPKAKCYSKYEAAVKEAFEEASLRYRDPRRAIKPALSIDEVKAIFGMDDIQKAIDLSTDSLPNSGSYVRIYHPKSK